MDTFLLSVMVGGLLLLLVGIWSMSARLDTLAGRLATIEGVLAWAKENADPFVSAPDTLPELPPDGLAELCDVCQQPRQSAEHRAACVGRMGQSVVALALCAGAALLLGCGGSATQATPAVVMAAVYVGISTAALVYLLADRVHLRRTVLLQSQLLKKQTETTVNLGRLYTDLDMSVRLLRAWQESVIGQDAGHVDQALRGLGL